MEQLEDIVVVKKDVDLDKTYIYIEKLYLFILINYSYTDVALFIQDI